MEEVFKLIIIMQMIILISISMIMIMAMTITMAIEMIMQRMLGIRLKSIIILLILWKAGWIGCLIRSRGS